VQGVTNTESFGVGVRVIANGTWGFGATNELRIDGIKKGNRTCSSYRESKFKISERTGKTCA
jgi:TldD protein